MPEALVSPIVAHVTVSLCRDHAEAACQLPDCDGLFGADMQQMSKDVMTTAMGLREPDWSRARFEVIRLDSIEHQEFLQRIGKAPPTSHSVN